MDLKTVTHPKLWLHVVVLFFTVSVFSQNDITIKKLKMVALEIIEDAGVCALTSLDEIGAPRTRAMDPFPPSEEFVIWFGTNTQSRKVEQIRNDPRVSVYYIAHNNSGYVSIQGIATLVDDIELKEKYWKKEWEDYYPENKQNYLLIKVNPVSMEVLSPPHGINNDPLTWKPPIVNFE